MCARGPRRRQSAQRAPGPGLSACAPFRGLSPSSAGPALLLGRDRGGQPGGGGPPGRTPEPFAAAVCARVISSYYPGFRFAGSGPESRCRGELGRGATAPPQGPLARAGERLYPNPRSLASCACVRPCVPQCLRDHHMPTQESLCVSKAVSTPARWRTRLGKVRRNSAQMRRGWVGGWGDEMILSCEGMKKERRARVALSPAA